MTATPSPMVRTLRPEPKKWGTRYPAAQYLLATKVPEACLICHGTVSSDKLPGRPYCSHDSAPTVADLLQWGFNVATAMPALWPSSATCVPPAREATVDRPTLLVIKCAHGHRAEAGEAAYAELQARLAESECREAAWMNGVADAVERFGYDRNAACGPADLLPGLAELQARNERLRVDLDAARYAIAETLCLDEMHAGIVAALAAERALADELAEALRQMYEGYSGNAVALYAKWQEARK